jgi:hypothetical protein
VDDIVDRSAATTGHSAGTTRTVLFRRVHGGHVGLCDVRDMASGTYGRRLFRGGLIVGQWVMSEGEESPAVGHSKTAYCLSPSCRCR